MSKKFIVKFDSKDTRKTVEKGLKADLDNKAASGIKSYEKENKKTLIFKTKNKVKRETLEDYLANKIPVYGEFKIKKYKEGEKERTVEVMTISDNSEEATRNEKIPMMFLCHNPEDDEFTILVRAENKEEAKMLACDYFADSTIAYNIETLTVMPLTQQLIEDYSVDCDYIIEAESSSITYVEDFLDSIENMTTEQIAAMNQSDRAEAEEDQEQSL